MDNNKLGLRVGIFLFDGVEPTDFIGPYDVFTAVDFGHPEEQTTLYKTPHDPTITLKKDERFIDNGRIITAAGVTAGYDAAMHITYKISGRDAFFKAGEILEYGDAWQSVQRRLAGLPVHRTITAKCIKCGQCMRGCPFGTAVEGEKQLMIQPERCVGIGPCAKLCPVAAIESLF